MCVLSTIACEPTPKEVEDSNKTGLKIADSVQKQTDKIGISDTLKSK